MMQTGNSLRERLTSFGGAAFAVALGLTAAGAGGLWLRSAEGDRWPALLAAALVALLAFLGLAWVVRARAWRRWRAGLDRFAERELSRARRAKSRAASA